MSSSETESGIKTLEALVKDQTLDLASIVALKQTIQKTVDDRQQSGVSLEEARLASPLQKFSDHFGQHLYPSSRDSTLTGARFASEIDKFLPALESYSLNGHGDSLKKLLLKLFHEQAEKAASRKNVVSPSP